jgi:iron(II)-dependent oxidoreductase
MMTTLAGLDREAVVARYGSLRERTEAIFDSVRPEAYESRPIPLRNPICFYEGHLPAFSVNTLLKKGLGDPGIDSDYEILFERGIDPEDEESRPVGASAWPSRIQIRSYAAEADRAIVDALLHRDVENEENPVLRRGLAVHTLLEHEAMHQETLQYIFHRLDYGQKIRPEGLQVSPVGGEPPTPRRTRVPEGRATLGAGRDEIEFGWDNEFETRVEDVPSFSIDVYSVTNRDYLEFVESGGYSNETVWDPEGWEWNQSQKVCHPLFWETHRGVRFWRGMWDLIPLPMAWPVYVSHAEASAYARWKGRRLPTEAEFHRAAFGEPGGTERPHPWGDAPPDATRGNFGFVHPDPLPVGAFPRGASAWGIEDLVGNGWEWTSSVFGPFPGFSPMPSYPQYSADFFDGKHYVMKGASPATPTELVRRSFRNWFRPNYPYVYAKFRTVS